MTLVMATSIGAGFALMTTDTREVFVGSWYDPVTKECTLDDDGEVIGISDKKALKVSYLSKYVMMGAGGTSDLCRHILVKMEELVKHGDDILTCGKKLTKLIDKMRGNRHAPPFFSFLNQEGGVMIVMNGFFQDGRNGVVVFTSGPKSEVEVDPTLPGETRYLMIPPAEKYYKHAGQLGQGVANGEDAYEVAVTLHAQISLQEPIKVSPDCHHFILSRDGKGQINKVQGEFDTTLLYEHVRDYPLD